MKAITNSDEMIRWASKAKRGEKVVYYNGMLIADRERHFQRGGFADTMPETMKAARAASCAMRRALRSLRMSTATAA